MDRDEVPECEGIEPEIPGPIIFVVMAIELNVRLVTFSSMVISTKFLDQQVLATYTFEAASCFLPYA